MREKFKPHIIRLKKKKYIKIIGESFLFQNGGENNRFGRKIIVIKKTSYD